MLGKTGLLELLNNEASVTRPHTFFFQDFLFDYGSVHVFKGERGGADSYFFPVFVDVFFCPTTDESVGVVKRLIETIREEWPWESHPGIARLIDVDFFYYRTDIPLTNVPLIFSEYKEGQRLAELYSTDQAPLPLDEVLDIFSSMKDALSFAHSKGVCHGNLLSEWVIVDRSGERTTASINHWLSGFSADELHILEYFTPYETRGYAPERLAEPDFAPNGTVASDIYSLAIILFEMLTAMHPFLSIDDEGKPDGWAMETVSVDELLALRKKNPPTRLSDYGIEDEIASVILKGLSYDPDERWESVEAFYEAFSRAADYCVHYPVYESSNEVDEKNSLIHYDDAVEPTPKLVVDLVEQREVDVPFVQDSYDTLETLSEEDEEYLESLPSPQGRVLAIAILLILLTNVGWAIFYVEKPSTLTSADQSLVRIESKPAGASLTEILPNGDPHLIGETPMLLHLREFAGKQVKGVLSKDGYKDTDLSVSSDAKAGGVVVKLGLQAK